MKNQLSTIVVKYFIIFIALSKFITEVKYRLEVNNILVKMY
jgi:hypothetical protein